MAENINEHYPEATQDLLSASNRIKEAARAGFTIVEMIVVVTVTAVLAALAISTYNKIVNDAKVAKSKALMSTLATAKAMWFANPSLARTTVADVQTFNGGPDANFAMVAPYIRVNGAQPTDQGDLLTKSGMPSAGVVITLGTVDDSSFGGQNEDQAPTVTGYGL